MRKGVVATVIGVVAVLCITVMCSAMVIMGYLDPSPYTDVVDCTLVGEATQAAIGPIFTLTLDGRDSVKVQQKQCFNFDEKVVGETFKVVVVYDEKDVLQSITCVED